MLTRARGTAGYISSLHIKQQSYFRGGITLGAQKAERVWSEELGATVHASWWEKRAGDNGSRAEGGSR